MLKGMSVPLAISLLEVVGSEKELFETSDQTLQSILRRPDMKSLSWDVRQEALRKAGKEVDFAYSHSIRCLYFSDEDYPQRLLQCDDAPVMLYVLGNCDLNASQMAGIVGTRHATPYGIEFTRNLVKDFRNSLISPVTIVSGLAYGIDVTAHQEALSQGLPTIGVVAHGLDMLYPAQHRRTAAQMVKSGGGIITEYPSSTVVHRGNFLARNRIVAGITDCLIVAESAVKGGALVTARIAADYDREVFALPGRISDRYSQGCNSLIARNCAHLCQDSQGIIELMGWPKKEDEGQQKELFTEYSPEEISVIRFLENHEDATTNFLSVNLGIPIGQLLSLMVELEFKGSVVKYPGGRYRLK